MRRQEASRDLLATVVIPALNSESHIEETLRGLESQTIRERLHVLVVDNGSTDGTLELACRWADETMVIDHGGCAGARNLGLARTSTPYMLSLDSDCMPVDARWAENHLRALDAQPSTTLATAGRSIPKPTTDPWAAREDITPHPSFFRGRPLYAVAGNACFRTEALRELGGFPGLAADDAGLGMRARRAGLEFHWAPEAAVYHANATGWRGYLRQMRKIGRYGIETHGPPSSPMRFYAERLRYIPGVLRNLAVGRWREAAAIALAAIGQILGARETWRRGVPEDAIDGRPPVARVAS